MKKEKSSSSCKPGNKILKLFKSNAEFPARQFEHLMHDYPMLDKAEAMKIVQELEEEYEHYYGE